MVQPEGNNWWTFNAYGKGKILPEQVNNELDNLGQGGVQAAIRNIMHSRETAQLLLSGTSNLEPSGTYGDCDVAAGNILTRDSDGLSRIVPVAAATGLNIDAVAKCVVASNDGTSTVKAKTSVLSTDVIVATRGPVDNALVDVRNIKTEDDILSMALGGNLRVDGLSTVYKMGVDSVGYRTIVLKSGDSLVSAVAALGGAGNIILLPGTYTGNITIGSAGISIFGSGASNTIISGAITLTAGNFMLRSVTIKSIASSGNFDPGTIIIDGCTIVGDNAQKAIYIGVTSGASEWTLRVMNCAITTTSGNGIECWDPGTVVNRVYITNTVVTCNTAGSPFHQLQPMSVVVMTGSKFTGTYIDMYSSSRVYIDGCEFNLTYGACAFTVDGGIFYTKIMISRCTFNIVLTADVANVLFVGQTNDFSYVSNCDIVVTGARNINTALFYSAGSTKFNSCTVYYNPGAAKTCAIGVLCTIATGNKVYKGAGSAVLTTPINATKGKAANDLDGSWTA